jgi:hypothetical protein
MFWHINKENEDRFRKYIPAEKYKKMYIEHNDAHNEE